MQELVLALLGGLAAGFIGGISKGGGLISIPVLLFMGLPVDAAIATNRFSAMGLLMGVLPTYHRAGKINWPMVRRLIPLAVLGGLIGSSLLVVINTDVLSKVVGIALLTMLPFVLYMKQSGLKSVETGSNKKMVGFVLYFLLMIYAGVFGGGTGIFLISVFIYFFGMTFIEANATNFAAWTVLSATATIVFMWNGLIEYDIGIVLAAGMFVGGKLGARTALKKGNAWVRLIFIGVIIVSSAKLLFG